MPEQQSRASAGAAGTAVAGNTAGGPTATMLTGSSGVAPTALSLGKNTLLGA